MPIIRPACTHFQTGDQFTRRIHTDMRLVPIKVLGLFDAAVLLVLEFALMFHAPARIRVSWWFAFLLPLFVFFDVDMRNAVDAAHNLDRTKLDAFVHRDLDNLRQHLFKYLQFPPLRQPFAKHRQGRMIRPFLIHRQPHKVFSRQVSIQVCLDLSLAQIVQVCQQLHFQRYRRVEWRSADQPFALVQPYQLAGVPLPLHSSFNFRKK